jgi:hypothetical protein
MTDTPETDSAANGDCRPVPCSAFRASVKGAVLAALWTFERSGYTPEELADEIADILDPPRLRSVVKSRAEIEQGLRDTPETDDQAEAAHNMCLYYDCQGKDDNIPYPVVVPAEFARNLERERDKLKVAVKWALGEGGGFGPRPKGTGAYWWRKELRQRAEILPNVITHPPHGQAEIAPEE